ncbi:hypothetical protein AB4Y45_44025 [Paraburkholderia sp. EG287A]|uniref:hypothetical protein n=1 Tax=unclassified Paraburkholderia TaxID=2615204 RepID=UPI0034D2EB92
MPEIVTVTFLKHLKPLLKAPSRLVAGIIKKTAARKGILPGILTALHTFGRNLQ